MEQKNISSIRSILNCQNWIIDIVFQLKKPPTTLKYIKQLFRVNEGGSVFRMKNTFEFVFLFFKKISDWIQLSNSICLESLKIPLADLTKALQ